MQSLSTKTKTTTKRVVANVNDEAFKTLKIAFASHEQSMQEAIIRALIDYYNLPVTYEQMIVGLTARQDEGGLIDDIIPIC